jgi:hypothetical protein
VVDVEPDALDVPLALAMACPSRTISTRIGESEK